jgi:hypothetical protein
MDFRKLVKVALKGGDWERRKEKEMGGDRVMGVAGFFGLCVCLGIILLW